MANVNIDSDDYEWRAYTERQPGEFNSDLIAMVSSLTRANAYISSAKTPASEWTAEQIKEFKSFQDDVEKSHSMFASHVAAAALTAYKSGETDLLSALNAVATSSYVVPREMRVILLGQAALLALELGQPKRVKRRKPLYPRWVKDMAVDIAVILLSTYPKMPLTEPVNSGRQTVENIDSWSVLQLTAELLAAYGLGPAPALLWRERNASKPSRPTQWIPTRTIHGWYRDRMRELGKAASRGRPKSRLQAPIR